MIELVVAVTEVQADLLRAAGRSVPLPIIVSALLDIGARDSLISQDIADQLDLEVLGSRDVFGVGGSISVSGNIRIARLLYPGVPADLLASAAPVIAVPSLNHLGARMILGRDVMSRCVVIYNGPHSSCTFAF